MVLSKRKPLIHGATKMKVTVTVGAGLGRGQSRTIKTTWSQALKRYLYEDNRTYYEKELLKKGWVSDIIGQGKTSRVEFALEDGYIPLEIFRTRKRAEGGKRILEEQRIKSKIFRVGRNIYVLGVSPSDYRKIMG